MKFNFLGVALLSMMLVLGCPQKTVESTNSLPYFSEAKTVVEVTELYSTDFAFLADGSQIIFGAARDIWVIPSQGGTARKLTNYQPEVEGFPFGGGGGGVPVWSKEDNKVIYYSHFNLLPEGGYAVLNKVSLEGGQPEKFLEMAGLANPQEMDFSPDKKSLLAQVEGEQGSQQIVLVKNLGEKPMPITEPFIAGGSPSWESYTGFVLSKNNNIYSSTINSGNLLLLIENGVEPELCELQASEYLITFVRLTPEGQCNKLMLANTLTGEEQQLYCGVFPSNPSWSSDCKKIAFREIDENKTVIKLIELK